MKGSHVPSSLIRERSKAEPGTGLYLNAFIQANYTLIPAHFKSQVVGIHIFEKIPVYESGFCSSESLVAFGRPSQYLIPGYLPFHPAQMGLQFIVTSIGKRLCPGGYNDALPLETYESGGKYAENGA